MTGFGPQPYLEAAREGRLVLQRCSACGHGQLPPMARCEACGSRELAWTAAAGLGILASFAVLHRAPDAEHQARVPYIYALVDLDEGGRIVTNVVGSEPSELRIGQRVRAVFRRTDDSGQVWPEFAREEPERPTADRGRRD